MVYPTTYILILVYTVYLLYIPYINGILYYIYTSIHKYDMKLMCGKTYTIYI